MGTQLETLMPALEPPTGDNLAPRLRFGLACVERVTHLLEREDAIECLNDFRDKVRRGALDEVAADADRAHAIANSHQGSRSLDGVGHAAVSATFALAKAIAGNARQASEYAAYAAVYGHGGYGATSDPESFTPERNWQARELRRILKVDA